MAAIGVTDATLLLEPCARNTAPAIALAALALDDPKSPMLVMPSDHVILDPAAFAAATTALLPLVEDGWLATYGIAPTGPETGYGYIQMAAEQAAGVHSVARFVEKPDAPRAAEMIAGGDHVWNGGIFLFRADIYLGVYGRPRPRNARRRASRDGPRPSVSITRYFPMQMLSPPARRTASIMPSWRKQPERVARRRSRQHGLVRRRQLGRVARTGRQGR